MSDSGMIYCVEGVGAEEAADPLLAPHQQATRLLWHYDDRSLFSDCCSR
jgi:hypothetical protein